MHGRISAGNELTGRWWETTAARANWSEFEPAIFGTLLEQALDKKERQRLGAHYTPRPYVERLVLPTIATVETAKHRVFQFLDTSIAPDNMLVGKEARSFRIALICRVVIIVFVIVFIFLFVLFLVGHMAKEDMGRQPIRRV